jgi:MFS-type transporter involved in bile tolerance (Atg22 family)
VAASALRWSVVKSVDIQVGYHAAFWLSLPAMLLYLLPMITLMADVLDHRFHWRDRFMLVMWVVLASSMLAVLYAFGIRQIRYNRAIGLQAGLEASLTLLLMTLLIALALNGLDSAFSLW